MLTQVDELRARRQPPRVSAEVASEINTCPPCAVAINRAHRCPPVLNHHGPPRVAAESETTREPADDDE